MLNQSTVPISKKVATSDLFERRSNNRLFDQQKYWRTKNRSPDSKDVIRINIQEGITVTGNGGVLRDKILHSALSLNERAIKEPPLGIVLSDAEVKPLLYLTGNKHVSYQVFANICNWI